MSHHKDSGASEKMNELNSNSKILQQTAVLAQSGEANYSVRLEFFSGPMDLLLHLVSQQEVAIEDVKMAIVAEQYLAIVSEQSRNLDLDRAADYLVIATTLLAIKSKSLLPVDDVVEESIDSLEDDAGKFFENLREKLMAYQITKERARALIDAPQLGVDQFSRRDFKATKPTPEMLRQPEDGLDIGRLFGALMKRIGESGKAFRVVAEPVSVVNYMMRILDRLSPKKLMDVAGSTIVEGLGNNRRGFYSLISNILNEDKQSSANSNSEKAQNEISQAMVKGSVIAGFVAVLELVKRGVVSVNQENPNSEIDLGITIDTSNTELTMQEISEARGITSVHDEQLSVHDEQLTAHDAQLGAGDKPSETETSDEKIVQISDYQSEKESEEEAFSEEPNRKHQTNV